MRATMKERAQQKIINDQHDGDGQAKQPDQPAGLLLCAGFAVEKFHDAGRFLTQGRAAANNFADDLLFGKHVLLRKGKRDVRAPG